jgi:4-alpha-glucanotransferase
METRGSGLLLHLTSLPSPFGIGDMGPGAYRFADSLKKSRQRFWQVLPLNPTDLFHGGSPYSTHSAFAGNTLLISPEILVKQGRLDRSDLEPTPPFPEDRVDFPMVATYKANLLQKAYDRFKTKRGTDSCYLEFCRENAWWLDDFVLFRALKRHFADQPWDLWPAEIRDREPKALDSIYTEVHERIEREKFFQHLFFNQWRSLKAYVNGKDIRIIGDLPIYVDYDSADVWAHPEFFKLGENMRPTVVSGVPPDYFSETGQLWGNPVYDWDALKQGAYEWWISRIGFNFRLYDYIRLDHFRGFVACWEVPADGNTAADGQWSKAPAFEFFDRLRRRFLHLPVVAEDLGIITPDVREIMRHFNFRGMRVLLFAFGDNFPANLHLPHGLERNVVLYTGTHDNNTIRGWFETEADDEEKQSVFKYLGKKVSVQEINWEIIRLAMMSVANTVIIPAQDIIGLGTEARMNTPAIRQGNWRWRMPPETLTSSMIQRLAEMTRIYNRE